MKPESQSSSSAQQVQSTSEASNSVIASIIINTLITLGVTLVGLYLLGF